MNRYERYKDSGIPWLGEVPEHWEIIRNKYILAFSKGLTITKENLVDDGIPCVSYGEIHSKYGFEVNPEQHLLKCVSEEYLENNDNAYLKNGDFVFADTSEDVKGSGNFTYLNSNLSVFAGYHTIVARPDLRKVLPRYLAYVFDSDAHRNQIRAMVKGVKVFSITQAFLKNTFVWLPSLEEQTAIAHYLDTKLGEIDALIDKQQTLLEKLAEQRTAVITHAVTKGLNPAAPMKKSGVEWLGDVPAHWDVKRLKFMLSEKLKYGANESAESDDPEQPRYIRITDIDEQGNLKDDTFKSLEFEKAKDYLLNVNDILLARSGATVGKSYLYKENLKNFACYAGYLIRARLEQKKFNANFVNYYFQSTSYWDWIKSVNIQATIQNVSAEKYNDFLLSIPDLQEQNSITDYLDQETAKIDRLCETVNQTIGRLKEYRTVLITQAVTGKIKVTDE